MWHASLMQLIDSHCHLEDPRFDHDRDAVLQRAIAAGVTQWIAPAVSLERWQRLAQLAALYPAIRPAYGLHPWFVHTQESLEQLPRYLEKAIAIGECGLDFALSTIDRETQLKQFRSQLELAVQTRLPLIVHGHKAVDAVIAEIKSFPGVRGVLHSFNGSIQQAGTLIDLGFKLGFGGAITRSHAGKLHRLIAMLPPESILLESDAPDQPPATRHGERNEPAYLVEITRAIANIRALPVEKLAEQCNRNCQELFDL